MANCNAVTALLMARANNLDSKTDFLRYLEPTHWVDRPA